MIVDHIVRRDIEHATTVQTSESRDNKMKSASDDSWQLFVIARTDAST